MKGADQKFTEFNQHFDKAWEGILSSLKISPSGEISPYMEKFHHMVKFLLIAANYFTPEPNINLNRAKSIKNAIFQVTIFY